MVRGLCAGLAVLSSVLAPPVVAASNDARDERSAIHLNSLAVDPLQPEAGIPSDLLAPAVARGASEALLVKFPAPPSAVEIDRLRAAARVYTYLPHDAFLVRAESGTLAAALPEGTWIGRYHPAYKLSRFATAVAPSDEALAAPQRIVSVQVFPDADLEAVAAEIASLGLKVVGKRVNPFFSRLRLLATAAEIAERREAIARIPEVFWIDLEPRKALLNDTTVWVGQSGLSAGQTTPIFDEGIYGEGQVVAVLDTGIDPDMCWFRDPARGLPPRNECNGGTTVDPLQRKVLAVNFLWGNECSGGISGSEWDTQDHGTHVAGTVAGDNFANPLIHDAGDGMAPGAKLVVQDCGYQVNACADCPGIGCPVVDLNPVFQQTYTQGARIHTNSWGDQEDAMPQNDYTAASQDVDEFMWNHKDFLIFFAAGNSGPGTATVGSPSTAKSAVSVGATLRGTSANSMASFSSCGPTDDGRFKPEITVPGSGIVSANNDGSITTNNCSTQSMSGTSMATPGAAGLAALARQYFTDGWYPSGSEVPADGFTPSAALLRATLVNSAASMTNATAIPSNCQGWGRVLLENALYFSGQPRRLWVEDDAAAFPSGSSGETRSYSFTVASGQSLKVTLAWTDFPSTPAASLHLVNDLDLVVTGPGGTWLGNVFASGQSTTGGSADRRNTLEQVLLASPAAGTYTVTVRSFTVPSGPQPFALVVTGNVSEGGGGNLPPVASAGPDRNVAVNTAASLDGSGSSDPDGGPSPLSYAWSQLSGATLTITGASQAVASVTPTAAGTYVFRLTVSDGAASASDDVTVTATTGGGDLVAVWDSALQAPSCAAIGRSCDSGPSLLLGRDGRGPEPNQPNTIADSCADGTSGTFHSDESNDRLKVSTVDGSTFATGKTVRVEATVWAWTTPSADKLDLYYAPNASSPSWTLIGTLTPTAGGAQTLSATYTLPAGALQAVRARFRYQGSAAPCGTGGYDDHDDLVFAVEPPPPSTAVFEDDFEVDRGWTRNPSGTDTATAGLWERGDPEATTSSGAKQLGTTTSGINDLVTGRLAGSSAGVHDVDGGVTSMRSPEIALPSTGTLTLTFRYYLAHGSNATSADYLRVRVVGSTTSTVLDVPGVAVNRNGSWATATANLSAFAGQTVRILVEAADAGTASLVEAAVDDVRITRQ
ncbi:MAG: hypothetical protein AMXMBFR36_22090 [Acidobacteriota bacterium]